MEKPNPDSPPIQPSLQEKPDNLLAPEKPRGILDAIEIAVARTELDEALFYNVPPHDDWPEVYEAIMQNYPNLAPYRAIFDLGFVKIEDNYRNVSNAWNMIHGFEGPAPREIPSTASGRQSERFCDFYLDFKPKDPPRLRRGVVSLNLILSDDDYRRYRLKPGNEGDDIAAHFELPSGIPLIVMPEKSSFSVNTSNHENQHANNRDTIRIANSLDHFSLNESSDQLSKTINSVKSEKYSLFKDEFLAYSTGIMSGGDLNGLEKLIGELNSDLEYAINNTPLMRIELGDSKEKIVAQSTTALKNLLSLLLDFNPGVNNARIAVNFLSQFPFERWPAAVRLLRSRKADIGNIMTQNGLLGNYELQDQEAA